MTLRQLCLQLTTLCVCLSLVAARPAYQAKIPNAGRVPNPCQPDEFWPGVGHTNVGGGSKVLNPFGEDFLANGISWKAVCRLDSDGDGKTNGEELGDPACEWKEGDDNPAAEIISHPGVCEPLTSTECLKQNSWLKCGPTEFNCPAINDEGVKTVSLRLPPTKVPAKETTYMCHAMALPQDEDYHIIATTPIINTPSLLHHVLIYLCDDITDRELLNGTKECFMGVDANCQSLIGLWGVGSKGQCLLDSYGFPIGKNGFKIAFMEVHWNNPLLDDSLVDSSGMTLYYTSNLRRNDAGVVRTGQNSLQIPPGLNSSVHQGTCTDLCTSRLAHPIYISWATIHMHLQGIAGMVELYRNGYQYKVLINSSFNYNSPPEFDFREPIEFLPGDEIKVTCEYQTLDRNETILQGESTSLEMCYAFLTYFPVQHDFAFCGQLDKFDYCSNFLPVCDLGNFFSMVPRVNDECDEFPVCTERCITYLNETQATKCLDGGDNEKWFKNGLPEDMDKLRNVTDHCLPFVAPSSTPSTSKSPSNPPSGASPVIFTSTFWLVSICAIGLHSFRFVRRF